MPGNTLKSFCVKNILHTGYKRVPEPVRRCVGYVENLHDPLPHALELRFRIRGVFAKDVTFFVLMLVEFYLQLIADRDLPYTSFRLRLLKIGKESNGFENTQKTTKFRPKFLQIKFSKNFQLEA